MSAAVAAITAAPRMTSARIRRLKRRSSTGSDPPAAASRGRSRNAFSPAALKSAIRMASLTRNVSPQSVSIRPRALGIWIRALSSPAAANSGTEIAAATENRRTRATRSCGQRRRMNRTAVKPPIQRAAVLRWIASKSAPQTPPASSAAPWLTAEVAASQAMPSMASVGVVWADSPLSLRDISPRKRGESGELLRAALSHKRGESGEPLRAALSHKRGESGEPLPAALSHKRGESRTRLRVAFCRRWGGSRERVCSVRTAAIAIRAAHLTCNQSPLRVSNRTSSSSSKPPSRSAAATAS